MKNYEKHIKELSEDFRDQPDTCTLVNKLGKVCKINDYPDCAACFKEWALTEVPVKSEPVDITEMMMRC